MEKYEELKRIIKGYGSAAVAFSGGVDSTLLLYAAKEALGEKAIAITVSTEFVSEREAYEAVDFCDEIGVKHIVVKLDGLAIEGFCENPPERCYICKKALFTKMLDVAKGEKVNALIEGSNVDDDGDYRPGMKALEELGIKSPLKEAGLSKNDIRRISKELGLDTWDKPAFACLASRFVYGERITYEKLKMVDEGEGILMALGIKQFRVRIHGEDLARIEITNDEADLEIVMGHRKEIVEKFKALGFRYIALDLQGYRTGSMNEAIGK